MVWKLGTLASVLALAVAAACGGTGGGGGGGGGGMNPDGGGGGGGGGAAWTAITLPGDHTDDVVTGIYYSSPTAGFITTVRGQNASAGAVFSATATSISGTAFDGNVDTSAGGTIGGLDFNGIMATPSGGLVAVTGANDLVSAPSATGTFTNVKNGTGSGGGQPAGAYFGANLTLYGIDNAGIDKATSAPGPNATYTDIFNPGSNPTVPNPIPADECQDAIHVNDSFQSGLYEVAFSADGGTIAYTSYSTADALPELCISTDGGQTFKPTELAGKTNLSGGVIFPKPSDPSTMIVYSGDSSDPNGDYVMRSTDGGKTFSPVTLPSGLTSMELYGSFFLADGQHGWIVGFEHGPDTGLALVTTDGGQTWTADASVAAVTSDKKLHSVYALDTSHVWIGGDTSTFLAHTP